jgi:hypothetical protein
MGRRRARGNSFDLLVARIDKRAALHYNYERSCPTREDQIMRGQRARTRHPQEER